MRKVFPCLLTAIFILSACGNPPAEPVTVDDAPTPTAQPAQISTATPTIPVPTATAVSLALADQPVFLAWPMPSYIGTARISQYPNSPWTWNYLGLNAGYQCPPMFGYLLNMDSHPYWRDLSIPEEQDKAQADPHNFEMVECYSTDNNVGANGHEGTDIKAPAGTPVYAAADGKVQTWRFSGMTTMLVLKHCLGGTWDEAHQCVNGRQWYTTYMHIEINNVLLVENLDVAQGTQVGTIYDQSINSHLHFETGLDSRSYTNFVNPWGRDEAPWLGCMWLDQSICVNPNPDYKRMALYTTSERLFIKQGEADPIEIADAQGLKQIRLYGERVIVMDAMNRLLVNDEGSGWKTLAENITEFQISNTRIAILDQNRNLLVKEDVNSEWTLQAERVRMFSVSDHRLGYLTESGDLFIKQDELTNEWTLVVQNVSAFQLNDNRVAVIDSQGVLFANEGLLSAEWEQMAQGVKAFQLTDVRLGILNMNDELLVKEGNLRAEWLTLAENVRWFQLADYRILMQSAAGEFKLKEGNLYQAWSDIGFAELNLAILNGGVPAFTR